MCASALRRDVQKTRKNVAGRAEFQMQRDPERLSRAFDVVCRRECLRFVQSCLRSQQSGVFGMLAEHFGEFSHAIDVAFVCRVSHDQKVRVWRNRKGGISGTCFRRFLLSRRRRPVISRVLENLNRVVRFASAQKRGNERTVRDFVPSWNFRVLAKQSLQGFHVAGVIRS